MKPNPFSRRTHDTTPSFRRSDPEKEREQAERMHSVEAPTEAAMQSEEKKPTHSQEGKEQAEKVDR
jgi:hypothetical protein